MTASDSTCDSTTEDIEQRIVHLARMAEVDKANAVMPQVIHELLWGAETPHEPGCQACKDAGIPDPYMPYPDAPR